MLKPQKFTVVDPIFKQRVKVFLNCAEGEWLRWQKGMNVANVDGFNYNLEAFSTHVYADGEPSTYVIWLNHFDWTLDDQESLIHEIIHTVLRIWETNGIFFSLETQEFYAHSVGRLYGTIASRLMKEKIRAKTKH